MLTRREFDTAFADFAAQDGRGRSMEGVGPGDNLFDAGVLDSFSVVRLIAFLERITGKSIDLDGASIESFASSNLIFQTFVEPHTHSELGR